MPEAKLIDWLLQGGAMALLGVVLYFVNKHLSRLSEQHHEQHQKTLHAFETQNQRSIEAFDRRNGDVVRCVHDLADRLERKHDDMARLLTNGHREAMRQAAAEVMLEAFRKSCPLERGKPVSEDPK